MLSLILDAEGKYPKFGFSVSFYFNNTKTMPQKYNDDRYFAIQRKKTMNIALKTYQFTNVFLTLK